MKRRHKGHVPHSADRRAVERAKGIEQALAHAEKAPTPLTAHATGVLRSLLSGTRPCLEINAGVSRKLTDDGFATVELLPYPARYSTKQGQRCQHLRITDKGRAELSK